MPAIGESIFLPEYESDFTLLDDKRKTEEKGRKGLLLVEGGLGAAFWFTYNDTMSNLSSEYGHTLFSPRTEPEKVIANVLEKFRPDTDGVMQAISKEYALCGPAFLRIYEILKTTAIYNQETGSFQYSEQVGDLRERLEQVKDIEPQSVIKKAIDKSDALAVKTLEIFVSIMGSVA
jgi:glucokinase